MSWQRAPLRLRLERSTLRRLLVIRWSTSWSLKTNPMNPWRRLWGFINCYDITYQIRARRRYVKPDDALSSPPSGVLRSGGVLRNRHKNLRGYVIVPLWVIPPVTASCSHSYRDSTAYTSLWIFLKEKGGTSYLRFYSRHGNLTAGIDQRSLSV